MNIKPGYNSKVFRIVSIIAISSVLIHWILRSSIPGSALLYVGIPFLISILLMIFTREIENPSWKQRFRNHSRDALIVMLGSSIILFEGFLCVLMFMPIYFGIMLLMFSFTYLSKRAESKSNKLSVHILPTLILISAFEGTHPNLSFDHYNEVSASKIIHSTPVEIKQNLVRPIHLQNDRVWFLKLFPMPYQVDAQSLQAGDIHRINYRYHRWFIANTHEGYTLLKIKTVEDNYIETEFIKDTSYISHYLELHGTEIKLEPISNHSTKVTLTIMFDRKLDPAWYFEPLQKYGVKKTAEYLITQMME